MALDPETNPNPFANLFTLPPTGGPTNQAAMESRRRMALYMMSGNARKGYPKTLGEGLSAIGDALGERGTMNQLQASEVAAQKQADTEAERGIPEEARVPAAAPQRSSEATPTTATAMAMPSDTEPTAVPSPVLGPAPEALPLPPVANAPAAGVLPAAAPPATRAVMPTPSDAPASFADRFNAALPPPNIATPPPAVNPRDAMAAALLQQQQQGTARGVPPANPTLGGQAPSGMPSPSGSVPLPGGQPDQRLAQMATRGVPGTATDIRLAPPVPSQLAPTPQRLAPQDRMPTPQDVPMTEDQKRGYRTLARGAAMGDVNIQRQGQALIDYGASQQKQAYDARLKDWQDQMLERRQRQTAEEAFARTQGTPQAQAEAQVKAREADIARRFGGAVPYQQFNQDMSKGHDAIQPLANTLPMYDQAKLALKDAYTGSGAETKLDASKMLRAMNVPGDYTPVAATEILRSRMSAIAAGFVKGTVGSQNISNQDVAFVQKAYSGDITMEPESLKRLLNIAQEAAIKTVNQHNDRLLQVANDPAADQGLRNMYRVPMQYGKDAEILKQQGQDPKIRDYFDQKYGKGHAAAVLRGVSYGD